MRAEEKLCKKVQEEYNDLLTAFREETDSKKRFELMARIQHFRFTYLNTLHGAYSVKPLCGNLISLEHKRVR